MAVDRPVIVEIERDIFQINEFGRNYLYLICGSERALLIDTGEGFMDLARLVRELTFLPYDVVLTCIDQRNMPGAGQFQKVFVHQKDVDAFKALSKTYLIPSASLNAQDDKMFTMPERIPWNSAPEVSQLENGQTFALGGTEVEVVYAPGRSAGSCCFIDARSKIAFTGRVIEPEGKNPEQWLGGLESLNACNGKFTRIYTGRPGKNFSSRSHSGKYLMDRIGVIRDIMNETNLVITPDGKKIAVCGNSMLISEISPKTDHDEKSLQKGLKKEKQYTDSMTPDKTDTGQ